jgi:DNA-binding CsgD family transcriptional regulator
VSTSETGDESLAAQLSIRYNQILGLFDRSPLATAICHADGLTIRVCNPAFAEVLGVARNDLKGTPAFDHLTPVDGTAAERLHIALARHENVRHELRVHWNVGDERRSGRVSFELVDDALIGNVPLLTYLHVDRSGPREDAVAGIEPVARSILELIARGETTTAIARSVDLTVDGVNYHIGRLCRRLGAANRTALVARAYVLGVLDVSAWPPRVGEPRA